MITQQVRDVSGLPAMHRLVMLTAGRVVVAGHSSMHEILDCVDGCGGVLQPRQVASAELGQLGAGDRVGHQAGGGEIAEQRILYVPDLTRTDPDGQPGRSLLLYRRG